MSPPVAENPILQTYHMIPATIHHVLASGRGSGDPASVDCTPYVHEVYTITSNSVEESRLNATVRFKGITHCVEHTVEVKVSEKNVPSNIESSIAHPTQPSQSYSTP